MFAGILLSSFVVFLALWYALNLFYHKVADRWHFVNRFVEKTRKKGEHRLVQRYGLVGLAILMAIPLPTIGVYGGTILSWLMGVKWWKSMIAVVAGATVSNCVVFFSVFGATRAFGLF